MTRVLILCYDFPPRRSASALRLQSWYQYLPEFGIHPIVVTKNWVNESGLQKPKIIQEELRTLLLCSVTLPNNKEDQGSKSKTMVNAIRQIRAQYNMKADDDAIIYESARAYLKQHGSDIIIASGGPFKLFHYATLLSKEFSLPWIADYRDEWKGNYSVSSFTRLRKVLFNYLALKEKSWTRTSSCFTTVSPPLLHRLEKRIGKKGHLVRNGIDLPIVPTDRENDKKIFTLIYAGTIYHSEYVDVLFKGLQIFLSKLDKPDSFQFIACGIDVNRTSGTDKFERYAAQVKSNVRIIGAIAQEEVLMMEAKAAICLNLVSRPVSDGLYSVKIYEYLALNKSIISLECGGEIRENEFSPYMKACNNAEDFSEILLSFYDKWKNGEVIANNVADDVIRQIDRRYQCGKLAEVIRKTSSK